MKNPLVFLGEVQAELAKVVWPTRDQTIRLTVLVIAISVFVGLFIYLLDLGFVKFIELLIHKG